MILRFLKPLRTVTYRGTIIFICTTVQYNSFEVLTCYFYYNLKDEFSEIGGDYVLGDDDDMPEVQL